MGRPHLSVMGVIYEALGFATKHYGTALRIAWLPVLLIILTDVILNKLGFAPAGQALFLHAEPQFGRISNFVDGLTVLPNVDFTISQMASFIGVLFIAAVLQTTYMVPLLKYAGNNEAPHYRTMHLSFGIRHLKYLIISAISFPVILSLTLVLAGMAKAHFSSFLSSAFQIEQRSFAEGSLHSIDTVRPFGPLNDALISVNSFLSDLQLNLSSIDLIMMLPVYLIGGYLMLRVLPWAALVAAHQPGEKALRKALTLTGGWNIFAMAAIVIVYLIIISVALLIGVEAIRFVFTNIFTGTEYLLAGYEGFAENGEANGWVRGLVTTLLATLIILIQIFLAAFQAGLGGALVHRARQ